MMFFHESSCRTVFSTYTLIADSPDILSDSTGSLATAVGILPFFLAAAAVVWGIAFLRLPDAEFERVHGGRSRVAVLCGTSD